MLKLYIGNKNYSSWSMRPWVLLKQAGIEFDEIMVRFDSFSAGSQFKNALTGVTPVGKVPVLVDGDLVVWDTLAIAEYVAERFPALHLWPPRLPGKPGQCHRPDPHDQRSHGSPPRKRPAWHSRPKRRGKWPHRL